MEMISLENFIISSAFSVGSILLQLWHYKRENVYFDEVVTASASILILNTVLGMLLPGVVFFGLVFAVMLICTLIDFRYMKTDAEVERKMNEEIARKTKLLERKKLHDKVMKDIGE